MREGQGREYAQPRRSGSEESTRARETDERQEKEILTVRGAVDMA